jgi:linoleoyl-CoA desaturase
MPVEEQRQGSIVPEERFGPSSPVRFAGSDGFHDELRQRVSDYFRATGQRPRDCPAMLRKSAVILVWSGLSYGLLVFAASTWWQAVPLAASLGLSIAAIGFNILHDARHGAYSDRPWVNRLMSFSLDLVGGSSFFWHYKHDILHHTYVNITGHDTDIDLGCLARLSPHQPRFWFHRVQHWYLWLLYGLLVIKWHFYDDFRDLFVGRIGGHRLPRPRTWDLIPFIVGKAAFFSLAFVVPLLLHQAWVVGGVYLLVSWTAGLVVSIVFQLAHCVEEANFPQPSAAGRIDHSWAAHQVATTVNFAPGNRVVSWLVGGLNFQIEHHLFPHVCHLHYPALAKVVEQTCADFGVRYVAHDSVAASLASHYRWLRWMGAPGSVERGDSRPVMQSSSTSAVELPAGYNNANIFACSRSNNNEVPNPAGGKACEVGDAQWSPR